MVERSLLDTMACYTEDAKRRRGESCGESCDGSLYDPLHGWSSDIESDGAWHGPYIRLIGEFDLSNGFDETNERGDPARPQKQARYDEPLGSQNEFSMNEDLSSLATEDDDTMLKMNESLLMWSI